VTEGLAAIENPGVATQAVVDPELVVTQAEFEIARSRPDAALIILANPGNADPIRVSQLKAKAFEQKRDHEAALAVLSPLVNTPQSNDDMKMSYVRLLHKTGNKSQADEWLDRILAGENPPLFARMFRAFELAQSGSEEGIQALQSIEDNRELTGVDRRRIGKTLADALDRSGRYGEAADYYGKLSGRMAQVVTVAESVALENSKLIDSGKEVPRAARISAGLLPEDPVFLFAWPGSGWEWMAAGLAAHPEVMLVADKAETQVRRRSLVSSPAGADELDRFTPDSAGASANAYWSDLKSGQLEPGNQQTVDTMWISADMLPTLARIFPSARVLVVSREPREMILDWFRSGYGELQDMAATFREQLEKLEKYREILSLEFIDVDGSAVMATPEAELQKVFSGLGLEWVDSIAEKLKASTPGIVEGRGGWKDYQDILAGPMALFSKGDAS
jgi:tetratricopeptide (TPR) repeat protein